MKAQSQHIHRPRLLSPVFALSSIALAFHSAALFANTLDTDNAPDNTALETIAVTGTYTPIAVSDASNNIAILGHDLIKATHAVTAAELLNQSVGVMVQTNNGMESLPSLRSPVLTGPGAAGAFVFAQDGVNIRAPGFANNNGLSELNLAVADEVQIIRGPASAIYGSNAVHGIINVLSDRLDDEQRLRFSLGPNSRKHVVIDASNEKFALGLQHVNDQGYRDESDFIVNKVDTKWRTEVDDATVTTTLSTFNLNQETAGFIRSNFNGSCFESDVDGAVLYRDEAVMRVNCDPDAYRQWQTLRLVSTIEFAVNDAISATIIPYYRRNQMTFRQHYLPSRAIEENAHDSIGLKTRFTQTLSNDTTLVYGVDIDLTEGKLTQTQERADMFSFGRARQQGVHYDYRVDANVIAPFIQLEHQLSDALRLSASARFDSTAYNYDNLISDGTTKADGSACTNNNGEPVACLYLRPEDREDDFEEASYKAGLHYRLSDTTAVFTSVASGFRAPQTTDLYRLQNQQSIGTIEAEGIDSIEIGIRHSQPHLSYELVAFSMDKSNFFFRDGAGLNVTDGKTSHRGIELSLNYDVTETFSARANWTYTQHRYEFDRASSGVIDGNEVDTAPEHIGNIQLNWAVDANADVSLEYQHVGEYYLDPANAHSYAGHGIYNLRAQMTLSPNVTLSAQLENVTDKRYASRADFAFGAYRFFGGQPRALHVGIELTL